MTDSQRQRQQQQWRQHHGGRRPTACLSVPVVLDCLVADAGCLRVHFHFPAIFFCPHLFCPVLQHPHHSVHSREGTRRIISSASSSLGFCIMHCYNPLVFPNARRSSLPGYPAATPDAESYLVYQIVEIVHIALTNTSLFAVSTIHNGCRRSRLSRQAGRAGRAL